MEFKVKAREAIIKKVGRHGTGGIVYVPKNWIGEHVTIIRGVQDDG